MFSYIVGGVLIFFHKGLVYLLFLYIFVFMRIYDNIYNDWIYYRDIAGGYVMGSLGGVCRISATLGINKKCNDIVLGFIRSNPGWVFLVKVSDSFRHGGYDLPCNAVYMKLDDRGYRTYWRRAYVNRWRNRENFRKGARLGVRNLGIFGDFAYGVLDGIRGRGFKVGVISRVVRDIVYDGVDLVILECRGRIGCHDNPFFSRFVGGNVVGDKGFGVLVGRDFTSFDLLDVLGGRRFEYGDIFYYDSGVRCYVRDKGYVLE